MINRNTKHIRPSLQGVLIAVVVGFVTQLALIPSVFALTETKLVPGDLVANDWFGYAISIDGDRAIVSSSRGWQPNNGVNFGAAYIFERNGGSWSQVQKLYPADLAGTERFGLSAALSGDYAIVTAFRDDDKGVDSGSAYVFERIGGVWTQVQKLTPSDGAAYDYFGYFIMSMDGDTALIGSWFDSHSGVHYAGSTYVFERIGGIWTETQKLTASDATADHHFGNVNEIKGNCALIGAEVANSGTGAVYFFERIGGIWTEKQKLTASDRDTKDHFGGNLSLNETCDIALVNAHGDEDPAGQDSGSVYVFERIGGVWVEVQKITSSSPAPGDWFGYPVTISGDYALLGEPADDEIATDAGAFYVYKRIGGVWMEMDKITASDAQEDAFFGEVRLDGYTALSSAWDFDGAGIDSGAAYIIDLDEDGDDLIDAEDNCASIHNPDQTDIDGDGYGDICVPPGTISGDVDLGDGSTVGEGSSLKDGVNIGENADVGANVVMEQNVTAGANLMVGDNTTINQDVVLGDDIIIGTDSFIAKSAQLGDAVTIGDRVTIEKAVFIGAGTSIGDDTLIKKESTIGANVLIGARVIVGSRVIILDGAVVGDDAVIPNGAIVE